MKYFVLLFLLSACGACAGALQKQAWPEPASASAPASAPMSVPEEAEAASEPVMQQSAPKGGLKSFKPAKNVPLIELKAFDRASVNGFLEKFKELDQDNEEIWVRINSGGGSVFGGQEIIHGLEAANARVVCVVDFKAYSMAFYTLQSSGCDLRLMTKRASLMAHEPSMETGGKAGNLRDDADALDALNEGFLVTAAERMRIPVETLRAKTDRRDWWLHYRDAEKWRAVDGWALPQYLPAPVKVEIKRTLLDMLLGG